MIKIFIGAILSLLDFTMTNGNMDYGMLDDIVNETSSTSESSND